MELGAGRQGVWRIVCHEGGTGCFGGEAGSGAPPVAYGKRAGDTTAPAVVPKGDRVPHSVIRIASPKSHKVMASHLESVCTKLRTAGRKSV